MLEDLEVLVRTAARDREGHLGGDVRPAGELGAEGLRHRRGVPAEDPAAEGAQDELVMPEVIRDGHHQADAIAQGREKGRVAHAVLLAGATRVGGRRHDDVCVRVEAVALEAHARHHEGAVAVEVAVDVAAAVLGIPGALLGEHVVEEALGAEGLLLRHGPPVVAPAGVGERGEVQDGEVAGGRQAAPAREDGGDGVLLRHGDDGHPPLD